MFVLTPGGAQLDSILGKIHPERLVLSENLFFIVAGCDMTMLELRSGMCLASTQRTRLMAFVAGNWEQKRSGLSSHV